MKFPKNAKTYSLDYRYYHLVNDAVRKFLDHCNKIEDHSPGLYSNKTTGCMVADMHRILLNGGIFLYPAMTGMPHSKLRLMYECNPFAFLAELCGGMAINGKMRILDLIPQNIHERCPVFIGNKELVLELIR